MEYADVERNRNARHAQRIDHGVRELGHLKPQLRDDLEFTLQRFRGQVSYIVEDRVRSKYFRIGVPEYRFISLLDGNVSIDQALASTAATLGPDALGINDVATVVRWLIDNELAYTSASRDADFLRDAESRRDRGQMLRRLNLMFIKFPLMNPDRLLDSLTPLFRWSLGSGFVLFWMLVVASGFYQVVTNWNRFTDSANQFLSSSNWIWIAVIWTALKLIHELFHGLVCKKYEGDVLEAGIIFILFAPIGYVDATSSWRFPSRWQRIHTAAAGMYIEFFIAGIAAWVWVQSEPGLVNHVSWNVILVASITTLLFNANPLMKFDGYYIFSDLMDIPNLYGEGQRFVKHLFRRFMLGVPSSLPERPLREKWIIGLYGIASLIWRVLVVATLLIIASTLFHGAGLVIAMVSGSIILLIPLSRFIRYLFIGSQFERPSILRFAVTACVMAGVVYTLITGVEVTSEVNAPAVVSYAEQRTVRSAGEGFVNTVHVRSGEHVPRGTALVTLSNPQLDAEIEDLELKIKQFDIQIREHIYAGRQENVEVLENRAADTRVRLSDLYMLRDNLVVRAPIDGTVLSGRLNRLKDRFVNRGAAIVDIAAVDKKNLTALIDQTDIDAFRLRQGKAVGFRINGRGAKILTGELERIEPRAERVIDHESLTAVAGGPIDVTTVKGSDGESTLEYARPYFSAEIQLPDALVIQLNEGETGEVVVRSANQTLGQYWYRLVEQWVDGVITLARSRSV
ncbi:MAG: peptidase M50 [marine bacterium B5-7]|nr:MAG: peptidase M50 [marine bacterium B5-7]